MVPICLVAIGVLYIYMFNSIEQEWITLVCSTTRAIKSILNFKLIPLLLQSFIDYSKCYIRLVQLSLSYSEYSIRSLSDISISIPFAGDASLGWQLLLVTMCIEYYLILLILGCKLRFLSVQLESAKVKFKITHA